MANLQGIFAYWPTAAFIDDTMRAIGCRNAFPSCGSFLILIMIWHIIFGNVVDKREDLDQRWINRGEPYCMDRSIFAFSL